MTTSQINKLIKRINGLHFGGKNWEDAMVHNRAAMQGEPLTEEEAGRLEALGEARAERHTERQRTSEPIRFV